jgi:HD-GYP domain-containing protein (c-di-GMP phosphodiesterase class II)
MGANTGVRSPASRALEIRRAIESVRAELEDPAMVGLTIGGLTLFTFALVRLAGGAPHAFMELGFLPVALAAWAFGLRGGLGVGVAVAAALGPAPALIGFDRVEGPIEWLIRVAAFGGVGGALGLLLERSPVHAGVVAPRRDEVTGRERDGLLALATAAESRDGDGGQHVRRLEITSRRLALSAGLGERAADELAWAAMFHDLGKLRVPERILLKPEALDPDEWAIVRLHPVWTEQALAGGEHLAVARQIGRSHHENWDGTGYPDRLYGDRIPLAARIVRIADAFDAMTNRRPYQQPVSIEAALEELQANAAHDFDPDLVRHFVELVRSDAALRTELTSLREA